MNEYLDALRKALSDTWRRATTFFPGRAPQRPRVDPSTPAPTANAEARTTVIARAEDAILDIVERIEVSPSTGIVLVVPREARALRDPAAWPHIAAVAKRNAISLGIVAARGDVRSYARQNGLPAASSVGSVVRSPHHRMRLGDREFFVPRIAWGGFVRGAILVVGLSAVALLACNTIPSAEVTIVPASEEMTTSMRVRLNSIAGAPDVELGVQPATRFEHTFTHTIAVVTTGEVEVPDEKATAALRFSNTTAEDVLVSAGTQVNHESGIVFTTDADVEVPAEATAEARATAVLGGTHGNVEAGTLIISDDLPDGVTVTNPASADGGTDRLVPAVSEDDVIRVSQVSDEVLRRVGERELFDAVTDGTVFPQTLFVSIFSQQPLANPGDPAETFLVDYTAVASALVVTEPQALRMAEALLLRDLGVGQALLPNSTRATLGEAQIQGSTITVLLTATGLVADLVDGDLVRNAISGDSPGKARAEIEEMLALEGPPRIDLRPGFIPWRWLPRNADRITITYAGPASLLPDEEDDGESSSELLTADSTVAPSPDDATAEATATATATP